MRLGVQQGAGFRNGDAAVFFHVAGDGLDHAAVGVGAEHDGAVDFHHLLAVDE